LRVDLTFRIQSNKSFLTNEIWIGKAASGFCTLWCGGRAEEEREGKTMKIRNLIIALAAVTFIAVPAMAQDDCATAVAPGTATDPCTDGTATGPLGSCTSGGGVFDVWYTFTATAASARIRTDVSSAGTDSDYVVLHSADGTCAGIDAEVGCSEDETGYLGDIAIEKLVVGDTYYVQLGSWGDSCTGGYTLDVTMPSDGDICGDGVINAFGEECDGGDDAACVGLCTATCNCPPPVCGNAVVEAGEECDGANDAACLLGCDALCACNPVQTPALPAWGVVGLALMLLAGGAFAFRRRKEMA
jgi:hypothetical protein